MLYDKPEKMGQFKLELAWLGCIFEDPQYCRQKGFLIGLDGSMFDNRAVFEIGHELLQDGEFDGWLPGERVLRKMMQLKLPATLHRMHLRGEYFPAMYRHYSEQIERRAKL